MYRVMGRHEWVGDFQIVKVSRKRQHVDVKVLPSNFLNIDRQRDIISRLRLHPNIRARLGIQSFGIRLAYSVTFTGMKQ